MVKSPRRLDPRQGEVLHWASGDFHDSCFDHHVSVFVYPRGDPGGNAEWLIFPCGTQSAFSRVPSDNWFAPGKTPEAIFPTWFLVMVRGLAGDRPRRPL